MPLFQSTAVNPNLVLNNKIYLDNLECMGNETSLLQCSHSGAGVHNCLNNEKMAIRCSPKGKLFDHFSQQFVL